MTVTALVPMKGHSARVPNKNIRPLAGRPLYHWITLALLGAKRVDRVVIETDSDRIEEDARRSFPDLTILRRPKELWGDDVPMNSIIAFHMSEVASDVYLQSHSTNPLLRSSTIDRSIERFLEPGDHDSLFAVNVWRTRFFWSDGRPVNHNPDELLPTQSLPPLLEENSNIYIFTKEGFAKRNHRIGKKPIMFEMEYAEALDIDEMSHFKLADALMTLRLEEESKAA
jgi:CMP-N-acetylneuraminic acid synthetase